MPTLIPAIRSFIETVIVVDDGSTDDTAAVAERAGAFVIRHGENLGKGAALKAGLSWALANGFAFAIMLDGDGQHDPAELPQFIAAMKRGGVDLVIGNRMNDPQAMPWLRRQVNRWMSRRLSRRVGRELPDTQCGLRLIRLSIWRELDLRTTHFEIESEMLLGCLAAGRTVEFIPIRTIYRNGPSKIRPILDTLRWFRWWWR